MFGVLVILCINFATILPTEVELEGLGKLKGLEETARDGSKYFSFRGIPYVEPPTGMFRFRVAAPVKPWEGVKDATQSGSSCIQRPYYQQDKVVGSEDCLFINVYTKSLEKDVKKPVLVYIHGGAFITGSASVLDGKYFMEQDIVLVTLQYRLGPLGFLSTEDKNGPGNYGLHDQQAALRWVQDHIHNFGGDKDLVTLAGLSAGGASVHYHLLSPNSDGLFKRAISFSGSALCWWANLPEHKSTTVKLATNLECPTESSEELLECLRGKSVEELIKAQDNLYAWHGGKTEAEPMNVWSPRVDKEAGTTAILAVDPHFAMEAGQIQPVPFLVSVADSEGIWRAVNYITQDDVMMEFMKDFDNVAPYALGLFGQVREDQMGSVIGKVKKYYLDAMKSEKDLDQRLKKVVNGFVQMLGDTMFNYPIDRMVKLHANKDYAPVWMYEFNYKHNHSLAYFDAQGNVLKGENLLDQFKKPTHANEVAMLFPVFDGVMEPLSEEEVKFSKKFIKFIVDYMVKGVPTQDGKYEMKEWKPIADGQLSHLVLGKYSGSQIGLPFQHRMKWWSNIPAYWKKDKSAPVETEQTDSANAGKDDVENAGKPEEKKCANAEVEEGARYADGVEEIIAEVEELTDGEVEEVEVEQILQDMKDEL